jgi:sugar/nucleoside kinase (ribokinase family)
VGREAGAKVILDPAPVRLLDELLRLLDVIRPNAAETEVLSGVRGGWLCRLAMRTSFWFGSTGKLAAAAAALATTVLGAQAGLPRRDAVLALFASFGAGKSP